MTSITSCEGGTGPDASLVLASPGAAPASHHRTRATPRSAPARVQLHALARLYDIQPSYYDVHGIRRTASSSGLIAMLHALGAPLSGPRDVSSALRARREALWQDAIDPVVVAWSGQAVTVDLRVPAGLAGRPLRCTIQPETGGAALMVRGTLRRTVDRSDVEGTPHVVQRLRLGASSLADLPCGYHELRLEIGGATHRSLLLRAPRRAFSPAHRPPRTGSSAPWGVFLPLYALHSARSWGAGDFGDLRELLRWVGQLGGGTVATLPLLAAFLDEPYDPSPYAPVSRLFWNEFYIDVEAIPDLAACPAARAFLESPRFTATRDRLRAKDRVDYRAQMALKREVLEHLASVAGTREGARGAGFRRYLDEHPRVADYARFRAACERSGAAWQAWPSAEREGDLRQADVDPGCERYHRYVQFLAQEQLAALADEASRAGEGLYLDLPLGVHRNGYDVWRERASFVLDASGGAPPDSVYTKGQDWGFAPLHPDGIRRAGYRYVIEYLRHHMRLARVLRVDHVMGLHRLFMIPKGVEAAQGVYVGYRAEELYAILSLESHRHGTWLVGENLGTVPSRVNTSLARHGVLGMYVVQYELAPKAKPVLRAVPRRSVASVNTHDMPPFAAYCRGLDLDDRLSMGLLDEQEAARERRTRTRLLHDLAALLRRHELLARGAPSIRDLLHGSLAWLSASATPLVLVTLEDLWDEMEPQNVPDSKGARPNWTRKARYALERLPELAEVVEPLRRIDRIRRRTAAGGGRRA